MKKYLIAVGGFTDANRDALTLVIREKVQRWWHWLPDVWLVIDERDEATSREWRELARHAGSSSGRPDVIVLDVSNSPDWSALTHGGGIEWLLQEMPRVGKPAEIEPLPVEALPRSSMPVVHRKKK